MTENMTVDELAAAVKTKPTLLREGAEAKWEIAKRAAAAFVLGEIDDEPDFRAKLKERARRWIDGDSIDVLFTELRNIASARRAEALGEPVRPWRDPRVVTVLTDLAERQR